MTTIQATRELFYIHGQGMRGVDYFFTIDGEKKYLLSGYIDGTQTHSINHNGLRIPVNCEFKGFDRYDVCFDTKEDLQAEQGSIYAHDGAIVGVPVTTFSDCYLEI